MIYPDQASFNLLVIECEFMIDHVSFLMTNGSSHDIEIPHTRTDELFSFKEKLSTDICVAGTKSVE